MEFLTALWMPIIISSIVLFFVSAAAWMASPHHGADFKTLENQEEFVKYVKDRNIAPGRYVFPNAGTHKAAHEAEFQDKYKDAPVGLLIHFGKVNMGQNMIWTFVYFLVVHTLLAYLFWLCLSNGDQSFMHVFRVAGTASVLTFTCSSIPNDIWFKRPMWTNILDGIVYGLISGLIFAALWPKA